MTRTEAVALLLVLLALVLAAMWWGWRNRARRDLDLPAPAPAPDLPAGRTFEGVYVSTTAHGDHLDRVVAHGLGTRSRVNAHVGPDGVILQRRGARSLLIPRADLRGAGRGSGMVGKFVERDGLAVVTWSLGPRLLDTGLRLRREDTQDFVEAVAALGVHTEGTDL